MNVRKPCLVSKPVWAACVGAMLVASAAGYRIAAQSSSTLGPAFERRIMAAALPESPFDLRFFSTAVKTDANGQVITDVNSPPPHKLVGAEAAGDRAGLPRFTKIMFANSYDKGTRAEESMGVTSDYDARLRPPDHRLDPNNQIVESGSEHWPHVKQPFRSWPNAVAVTPDGAKVYVTLPGREGYPDWRVAVVNTSTRAVAKWIDLRPAGQTRATRPDGIAISPLNTSIFPRPYAVVVNEYANFASVIDTGNDSVVGRFAVGLDAYGLALDGDTLYVSNWGDQAGRGAGVGTVSVVPLDPTTHVPTGESRFVAVGHHPSALEVDPASKKLFVADTNDDQVSVVDTSTSAVTHVPVGVSGAPIGTHPDAFALSPDGSMLLVALAGLNAVQVLDATTGMPLGSTTPSGSPTYIPTGWYPAALRAVPGPGGRTRLWVANAKGEGPGPGINGSVFADGNQSGGTISRVDVDPSRFRAWTQQVIDNDGLDPALDACSVALGPSPAVCPAGSSAIKHVVYIVAENKTFDQYFGDLAGSMPNAGYNADPSYLLYGQPVTPNQHKMLADGVAGLGDNFFSDAEVSVTGHSYTSGAIATDHNEKTWPADYDNGVRGTHGGGDPLRPSAGSKPEPAIQHAEDVLNDPQGGYLFESFVRAGAVPPDKAGPGKLSMGIYGEHTLTVPYNGIDMAPYKAKWTRPDGTTVDWKAGDLQYFDTCRAGQFVSGKTTGGNSPDTDYSRDCEARQLDPQYVLKHWEDAYNGLVPGTPKGTDVSSREPHPGHQPGQPHAGVHGGRQRLRHRLHRAGALQEPVLGLDRGDHRSGRHPGGGGPRVGSAGPGRGHRPVGPGWREPPAGLAAFGPADHRDRLRREPRLPQRPGGRPAARRFRQRPVPGPPGRLHGGETGGALRPQPARRPRSGRVHGHGLERVRPHRHADLERRALGRRPPRPVPQPPGPHRARSGLIAVWTRTGAPDLRV